MQPGEALKKARLIVEKAGFEDKFDPRHFLEYSDMVAYLFRNLPPQTKSKLTWKQEFAECWAQMRGDWDKLFKADPMIAYRPINKAAYTFHRSPAYVRYFRAGNRSSKTQSGYAEHYYITTHQHPWLDYAKTAHNTFIVSGVSLKDYFPKTWLRKLVVGEAGNYLSPMFPEGGKWFHHLDRKGLTLTLKCPPCANAGRDCPNHHVKSTISLLSSEQGVGVCEAFTATLAHGDEHIPEEFYQAMKLRVADNPDGRLIFTGTPLHGMDAWENTRLAATATGPDERNLRDPENPSAGPLVSMHYTSAWDANVISHQKIRELMQDMDEFEVQSRVEGKPAPLAKNPVYDRKILAEMRKDCQAGVAYQLDLQTGQTLETAMYPEHVKATPQSSNFRVYAEPEEGSYYIIGIDPAAGMTSRDPSCMQVMKIRPTIHGTLEMEQVAVYHGWRNPLELAEVAKLIGVWYNYACVVIELTGGHGRAVMLRLKELSYWNIFADTSRPEQMGVTEANRLGIDTNASSKPAMVAAMQKYILDRTVLIRDEETIMELSNFEQELTESKLSVRYRGAGGMHDDRAMALTILAYVLVSFPAVEYMRGTQEYIKKVRTFNDEDWGEIVAANQAAREARDPFI